MRESVEESTKAIEVIERLLEKNPANAGLRNRVAMMQINLGCGLSDSGRTREAEVVFRRSCDSFERLAEAEPNNTTYRNNLAFALGNLSGVWARYRPARRSGGRLEESRGDPRKSAG